MGFTAFSELLFLTMNIHEDCLKIIKKISLHIRTSKKVILERVRITECESMCANSDELFNTAIVLFQKNEVNERYSKKHDVRTTTNHIPFQVFV